MVSDVFFLLALIGMALICNDTIKQSLDEDVYKKSGLVVAIFFILAVLTEVSLLVTNKAQSKFKKSVKKVKAINSLKNAFDSDKLGSKNLNASKSGKQGSKGKGLIVDTLDSMKSSQVSLKTLQTSPLLRTPVVLTRHKKAKKSSKHSTFSISPEQGS